MNLDEAIKKIRKFYLAEKRPPTYSELCQIFNYSSKSSVHYLVEKLIEAGVLARGDKGKLLPRKLFAIPHLGYIKAGYPMPAFAVPDDSIDVYDFIHDVTGDIYFLTVSGDSMIDAHIEEGDKVIIDPSIDPRDGDIVAAIVDNEWTIKYFKKINGRIALVPANDKYPVIYPKESLVIGGVLKAVIRKYR